MSANAKLLDALMGTQRNEVVGASAVKDFTESDNCTHFLAGLCPYELFSSTKLNLGECPKHHSQPMKMMYDQKRKEKDYGYEFELRKFIRDIVQDCDNLIEANVMKLRGETRGGETDALAVQISALQARAEELGEQGKIEEYLEMQKKINELNATRQETISQHIPTADPNQSASQHQKLVVCDMGGSLQRKIAHWLCCG
eukprot:TRINITY_DN1046_c0_g1_i3.p1 TRINITY_DN1046_c0_g1~~TRINITY_DN1046_c0_g1_i3.p1  ORF type:complete len:199 (-),score=45.71 TRINITY_DN1046_c0_g1_i3:445-1041(-)